MITSRYKRDMLAVIGLMLMALGFVFDDTDTRGLISVFTGSGMVLGSFYWFVTDCKQYRIKAEFVIVNHEERIMYLEGILENNNIDFDVINESELLSKYI